MYLIANLSSFSLRSFIKLKSCKRKYSLKMSLDLYDPKQMYATDPNLRKQDVEIIREWLSKQPHLPQLEDIQILLALKSCKYQVEAAKTCIENNFTVRNLCPEIFFPLTRDVLKVTAPVACVSVLQKKTPEGYSIILMKLLETKPDVFNSVNLINYIFMYASFYLHKHGYGSGVIVILDAKGLSLSHIGRINLNAVRHALWFVQEGLPLELISVHVINASSLVEKLLTMVKPFIKKDLFNLINFYPPNSDNLYKVISKECMPEEYGGTLPSSHDLNRKTLQELLDNYDFQEWHGGQKTDESKRIGKSKIVNDVFGTEGTFKKLEID